MCDLATFCFLPHPADLCQIYWCSTQGTQDCQSLAEPFRYPASPPPQGGRWLRGGRVQGEEQERGIPVCDRKARVVVSKLLSPHQEPCLPFAPVMERSFPYLTRSSPTCERRYVALVEGLPAQEAPSVEGNTVFIEHGIQPSQMAVTKGMKEQAF